MSTGAEALLDDLRNSEDSGWHSPNKLRKIGDHERRHDKAEEYAERLLEDQILVEKTKFDRRREFRDSREDEINEPNLGAIEHINEVIDVVRDLRENLKAVCPNGHMWEPRALPLKPLHIGPCPECGAPVGVTHYEHAIDD